MEKPTIHVDLQGPDGNVFALMRAARAAILSAVPHVGSAVQRRWNREEAEGESSRMMKAVMQSHSFDEALNIVRKYVNIEEKGGSL